ncbi:MAG: hypothetical protein HUU10_00845 [Bacteroidetes bacterium]|nr:hypothetical protein [Bacteroidota bacterium]
MKSVLYFLPFLVLMGCEPETVEILPPDAPVMIQPDSLIRYHPQTGFSAEKGTGPDRFGIGVTIRWQPIDNAEITQLRVYRTNTVFEGDPVSFRSLITFPRLTATQKNEYRDTIDVETGVTYYYRMTALNGDKESAPSKPVAYQILTKPILSSPVNGVVTDTLHPLLTWNSNEGQFLIFVRRQTNKELVWAQLTTPPSGYGVPTQSIPFGREDEKTIYTWQTTPLKPDEAYEWSVMLTQTYFSGTEYQFYSLANNLSIIPKGSITPWASFRTSASAQ